MRKKIPGAGRRNGARRGLRCPVPHRRTARKPRRAGPIPKSRGHSSRKKRHGQKRQLCSQNSRRAPSPPGPPTPPPAPLINTYFDFHKKKGVHSHPPLLIVGLPHILAPPSSISPRPRQSS